VNDIIELDKSWSELLYSVCEGKASEMAALKRYDIMEFFDYVESKTKKNG